MTKKVKKAVEKVAKVAETQLAALPKFVELDSSSMVNFVKAKRAHSVMENKGKPKSNEIFLFGKHRGEGLRGQELFEAIYLGLGGLLNRDKAKKNRENEKKAAKVRASR